MWVILFLAAAAGPCYIAIIAIQRLLFHPLSKYPGPFLAKLTNLYAAYHAWKGDLHIDMWRCHEKYGDIVRYAPNRLLFNSAEGLRDIYSQQTKLQKGEGYDAMVHRAPNTLTLRDRKEHGRKRRILSQGLSESALRSYGPTIVAQVQHFCERLPLGLTPTDSSSSTSSQGWSEAQNVARWCEYLTFDIMASVIFGLSYDLIGKPEYRFVTVSIEQSNIRIGVLSQAPELSLHRLDYKLFPSSILARNRFVKFVTSVVRTRMQTKSDKVDVFSHLMDAKDPETGASFELAEIGAEATTLIVAGSDTTSTAMAGLFFYLSHNASAYARAAAEVRSHFDTLAKVGLGTALSDCAYLRACIDETQRLSPAVGSALWRQVLPGGHTVDGNMIPAGCEVGTGIYSIHHNPNYFPSPFEFRPERWLADEIDGGQEAVLLARQAYNPFSIGPRSCIGRGLGSLELLVTFAAVLVSFDFRLAGGEEGRLGEGREGAQLGRQNPGEFQLLDHLVSSKDGPMIEFFRREGAKSE